MIKVEKLSYAFPEKDLYKDVSFTIEDGQHAVLIGSNGTGKTTLVDILLNDDKYMYDGKIVREMEGRVGYVSQYEKEEKDREVTVFDFLAEDFVRLQAENEAVCKEMETNFDDMEALLEKYADYGILNMEDADILDNAPFNAIGKPQKIIKLFGGYDKFEQAIKELESEIYKAA